MNAVLTRIIELVERTGLTELQWCYTYGIPQSTWYSWKSNDRVPTHKYLPQIADALNVSVDFLLNGDNEAETQVFDVSKELNDLIRKLNISDQLAFSGETLTDELTDISKEQLLMSLKFILNQQQHLAEQD